MPQPLKEKPVLSNEEKLENAIVSAFKLFVSAPAMLGSSLFFGLVVLIKVPPADYLAELLAYTAIAGTAARLGYLNLSESRFDEHKASFLSFKEASLFRQSFIWGGLAIASTFWAAENNYHVTKKIEAPLAIETARDLTLKTARQFYAPKL